MLGSVAHIYNSSGVDLSSCCSLFYVVTRDRSLNILPRKVSGIRFNRTSHFHTSGPGVIFVLTTGRNRFPRGVGNADLLDRGSETILDRGGFRLCSCNSVLSVRRGCFTCVTTDITSEGLCVSCRNTNGGSTPSSLVASILRVLNSSCTILHHYSVPRTIRVNDERDTFRLVTGRFSSGARFSRSLGCCFEGSPHFGTIRGVSLGGRRGLSGAITTRGLFNGSVFLSTSEIRSFFGYGFECFYGFNLVTEPHVGTRLGTVRANATVRSILRDVVGSVNSGGLTRVRGVRVRVLISGCLHRCLRARFNSSTRLAREFGCRFVHLSGVLGFIIRELTNRFDRASFRTTTFRLGVSGSNRTGPCIVPLRDNDMDVHNSVSEISALRGGNRGCIHMVSCGSNAGRFGLDSILCKLGLRVFICLFTIYGSGGYEMGNVPTNILCVRISGGGISINGGATRTSVRGDGDRFGVGNIILCSSRRSVISSVRGSLGKGCVPFGFSDSGGPGNYFTDCRRLNGVTGGVGDLVTRVNGSLRRKGVRRGPVSNTKRSAAYRCYSCFSIYDTGGSVGGHRVRGLTSRRIMGGLRRRRTW